MPINLYDGVSLFGVCVKMTPGIAPRMMQHNTYPGVNGVESLDLGGRGRTTEVTGILVAPTVYDLLAARTFMESYNDGIARWFYDSSGAGWTNVLMGPTQFKGGFRAASGVGYTHEYSVVMTHLTQT